MRRVALRLIALMVLLSGAADYFAFDVSDPLAPMNASPAPGFTSGSISHRMNPAAVGHSDSQEAAFPAQQIGFRGVVVIATANDFFMLHRPDSLLHVDPPTRA